MADRRNQSMVEWLDISLETLSEDDKKALSLKYSKRFQPVNSGVFGMRQKRSGRRSLRIPSKW
jgi:hypothetical protein